MEDLEYARPRGAPETARESTDLKKRSRYSLDSFLPSLAQTLPALIVVLALFVWEMSVYFGLLSALFFPAPSTIAQSLIKLISNGELLTDLFATLSRLVQGLLIGGSSGLLLGLLMGYSQPLRTVVDPFIAAIHPMPKISLLPLVMIIFGIGEASKIVLIAMAGFFPMLINTMAGVQQINPIYFEVAQNYGASTRQLFRRVVLPASLPLILTGARLALNSALVITIAVELLSAQEGLGSTIWFAWQTLRTEELYATLFVIALLGIGANWSLERITPILTPWQKW